ncbi:nuclear transport factor 2 family protein [Subtercola frigoramans]|uniref:SnoaL-like domain-containing protein n=1 Tax=Subtercola frigoramans TaxID=120298 RepID=A0ABS2L7N8_9MICO|nr:nuclear transport factor 2 family protein [Subtercola frigoramans]MBM7473115.1 hypothetical protein [Subtercola frigoramans]
MLTAIQARNLATVQRFYQAERDRDLPTWVSLWHEDGLQTFPTIGVEATVSGIADLEGVTREKFETRPPYGIRAEIEALADSDRVLALLDLDFAGRPPITIWCLFTFDEAGRVVEVQEMLDRGSIEISQEL